MNNPLTNPPFNKPTFSITGPGATNEALAEIGYLLEHKRELKTEVAKLDRQIRKELRKLQP